MGVQASGGHFTLPGSRLLRVTATGTTVSSWICAHLIAPFSITVAGRFDGTVELVGSSSLDPPDDTLTFDDFAPIGEILSARGSVGSSIGYRWIRVRAVITTLTSAEIHVDLAGFSATGQRG